MEKEFHHEKFGKKWIRAESIEHLAYLKYTYPNAQIIGGSTELSIEKLALVKQKSTIFLHAPYYLDNIINLKDNIMVIGCTTTLSNLANFIENLDKDFNTFEAIDDCLKYFGSNQIRNVATVAGNVYTSSPISDLIPILVASKSSLVLRVKDRERNVEINQDFFVGYRKNIINDQEIIRKFIIPISVNNEYIRFYKQAKRKYDDISIINACFFVKLTTDRVIENIRLVYGGISFRVVEAKKTEELLIGLKWDVEMSEIAVSNLMKELFVTKGSPGGEETYRNNMILSLFFKFFLDVTQRLDGIKFKESLPNISGIQLFDSIPNNNTIGKPLAIPAALKHTTGESDFISDMPRFKDELVVYPVISKVACAQFHLKNKEEILKLNGIIDIWDGEKFYENWDWNNISNFLLSINVMIARKETFFAGQPIYFVIASDLTNAQNAVRLMEIAYKSIKSPILTIDDAIARNSFHELGKYPSVELGNVKEEFEVNSVNLFNTTLI